MYIEILPIFTRLELEDGRWVPRHWPPHLGRRRSLPKGAKIHPSVYELHRAGILTSEQLPQTGGSSPYINPSQVFSTWKQDQGKPNGSFHLGKEGKESTESSREGKHGVSSILANALTNGSARL